jgi:hypothetical protein
MFASAHAGARGVATLAAKSVEPGQ